ncbi:prolyl oligopeptidase family serine peptidase [Metallosphaera tengchongensis]|uniref:Prolyl oligopeptidase family serine peptidase n=1 Tax=Metallosphaera tengchongensis TaxID=1532350 RepID=A0A6N0NYP0_9CREN|nr:prolyl oligopeptidase family serine peptidase [Metallosphaera tengchongensis]QKR00261.1 prolyl oligopeptidase family serine peptidase [Metallosphaera tengchongensis]
MLSLVLHGRGSSPDKVDWLAQPLKRFGDVKVPQFEYDVEDGLRVALSMNFDIIAGHSRGGTIALLAAAKKGVPVIAVSAPSDRLLQLSHLSKFPEGSEQRRLYSFLSSVPQEKLVETSPVTYSSCLRDVLLIHGEHDEVVPKEHSELLCKEVRSKGNKCELVILEMRHSPPKHMYGEISKVIQAWVEKTLMR